MFMKKFVVFMLMILAAPLVAAVDLSVITPKGYVKFAVPDSWAVLAMHTKMPKAIMSFQIPNLADEGSADSTNLAISIYDQNDVQGQAASAEIGKTFGGNVPKLSIYRDWHLYTQEAAQGATVYSIVDAKKKVADVTVAVRIAWPHLPNNPQQYDLEMKSVLASVLNSVSGGLGEYKAKKAEVIRRQAK